MTNHGILLLQSPWRNISLAGLKTHVEMAISKALAMSLTHFVELVEIWYNLRVNVDFVLALIWILKRFNVLSIIQKYIIYKLQKIFKLCIQICYVCQKIYKFPNLLFQRIESRILTPSFWAHHGAAQAINCSKSIL